MNKQTISLDSSTTSYNSILSEVILDDHSELSFNLSNVYGGVLPLYLKIDWGDLNSEVYENDVYVVDRNDVNALTYNPVLNKTYSHEYYPSDNSLYKSLSAQILVSYSNGDYNWFIVPIKIRTHDYFESIYDMDLHSVNVIPTYPQKIEYSIVEKKNNYLVTIQ